MTHFLGRLVERARGTAPRVEPIIAPRFAPALITEIASDVEASPRTPEIASDVEVSTLVRPETRGPETPAETSEPFGGREKVPAETPTAELIEHVAQAVPESLLVPLHRPDDDVLQPPANTRENGHLRRDVPPPVPLIAPIVRQGNPNHQRRATFRSVRPALSGDSLTSGNEPVSNDRPIVRVTIGRIEVRAETPTAPPRRKTPSPSEPKLTLDAYLKARKEGAR